MKCRLYNLKLAVKNLDESVRFFCSVFKELGFENGKLYDDPVDMKPTYVIDNGQLNFELVEEPSLVPDYDLSSIRGPRIEFLADSKETVDRFYEHLKSFKVKILASPQYFFEELLKDENDFWYAVYFADPNSIKYGLVYTQK